MFVSIGWCFGIQWHRVVLSGNGQHCLSKSEPLLQWKLPLVSNNAAKWAFRSHCQTMMLLALIGIAFWKLSTQHWLTQNWIWVTPWDTINVAGDRCMTVSVCMRLQYDYFSTYKISQTNANFLLINKEVIENNWSITCSTGYLRIG